MNSLIIKSFVVVAGLIVILGSTLLEAQSLPRGVQAPSRKMEQRAASLVRLGRTAEAIDLYMELLYSNPKNNNLYFQLSRLMPGKAMAPTLLQILDDILKSQDQNLRLLAERGRLLYLLGQKQEAVQWWEQLIQARKSNRYLYPGITRAMLEAGAFDEAIQLLLNGRKSLNDPTAFAMDLARIYGAKHNYELASYEYLTQLDHNPGMLDHIVTQLLRFLEQDGAFEQVDQSFELILNIPGEHPSILLARAKLYIHEKRYDECVQSVLGTAAGKSLKDVFNIANDLLADQAWDAAAELYLHVSLNSKDQVQKGKALLRLASTYEHRLQPQESYTSLSGYFKGNSFFDLDIRFVFGEDNSLARTLKLYDSLQTILPKTNQAFQASFQIADIQLTYSGDIDRAIRGFQNIFKNAPDRRLRFASGIRLVDAWLARGNTNKALQSLDALIQVLNLDEDDPRIIASRIKILIHKGDLAALKKELLNLSGAASPANPLFNDGLELKALIEGNGPAGDPGLESYFRAERLVGQHKLTQAIDLLLQIKGPATSIADEAAVRAIQLLISLNKMNRAVEAMELFLESYPDSDWRANVLIWRGEHYQYGAGKPQAAIPYYESVIIEHPGYLGIQEVRLRLRNILGSGS